MTTLREAAQQALEALENGKRVRNCEGGTKYQPTLEDEAITALRAALAEPQSTHSADCFKWHHRCAVAEVERLRAAPEPESKTPAWWMDGLAATLMREGVNKHRAREIAQGYWAAYCETALAEPVQEAACHVFNVTVTGNLHEWEPTTFAFALRDGKHALFTAPQSPQRKPLTDDQLDDIAVAARRGNLYDLRIAIEQAHGIGDKE